MLQDGAISIHGLVHDGLALSSLGNLLALHCYLLLGLCLASSNCSLGLLYNDLLGLALLPLYLHSLPTLNLNLTWLDQLNLWKKESERNINYASDFSLLGLSMTKSSLRVIYCCTEKESSESSLFPVENEEF